MKRKELLPKLKSSAMYLALGLVLKPVCPADGGPAESVSSMMPGVVTGGSIDWALASPNGLGTGSVPDRTELSTFLNRDAATDIMTSFSGESQVSAGVGDACASVSAFMFPLASAPPPASPKLLVAGTLGLMLVGWWKIRTLEL